MSGGPLPIDGGYPGQAWFQTGGNSFQALDFMIRQVIAGKAFSGLVKVMAVHGGGISSPATVDVLPLVNQQDVLGNQQPHETVYGLPCFRYQGGAAACVIDPVAGDIGHAIICDRDISGVKASGAQSPPGSYRHQSWSDGIYYGGVLNGSPTVYVQITGTAVNIAAPTVAITGNLTVTGEITAGSGTGDSVTLQQHRHGTGTAAAGTSTPTGGT